MAINCRRTGEGTVSEFLALVTHGQGTAHLEQRRMTSIPSADVVVAPEMVGLCGTDLEIIDGLLDPEYLRYPVVLGHEWCGQVLDTDGKAGARVVAEGIIPCWTCRYCIAGRTNLCENYSEIGFTRDGAAAELISVPRSALHLMETHVSRQSACLVEPAAVAYRALEVAGLNPGDRLLVVGDGTVGLLIAYIAALWHPGRVDMLGARSEQAQLAALAGVATFSTTQTDLQCGYDRVLEAAGRPQAVEAALAKGRPGGSVVMLGLSGKGAVAHLPIDDLVNRDLTVRGSFSYTSSTFAQVVELVNAHLLDFAFLVTHRFALAQAEAAISQLRQPSNGARAKVVIDLSQS